MYNKSSTKTKKFRIELTPEYRTMYWAAVEQKKKIENSNDEMLQNLPDSLDKIGLQDIGHLIAYFRTQDKSLDDILLNMKRQTDH